MTFIPGKTYQEYDPETFDDIRCEGSTLTKGGKEFIKIGEREDGTELYRHQRFFGKDEYEKIDLEVKKYHKNRIQAIAEEMRGIEDSLQNRIDSLELSGNPDDWILASGLKSYKMGVIRTLSVINKYLN